MESLQFSARPDLQGPLPRRLSKMYSDTKRSWDTVTEPPKVDVTPELTSLHRKLRIQKDRLITWGLEWSDTSAAQPGDIDESLEREGLGDVVGSVMSSIKEILDEAEHMRYSDPTSTESPPYGPDAKSAGIATDRWQAVDKSRFEDLLQQLTTSIDNLYRLSTSRSHVQHAQQRKRKMRSDRAAYGPTPGAWPTPDASFSAKADEKTSPLPGLASSRSGGAASSLLLDRSCLVIESDSQLSSRPPPYELVPTPSNARTMGYLKRPVTANNPWRKDVTGTLAVPVFIEYAPYDPVYSSTGISPPTARLEALAEMLSQPEGTAPDPELRLLNLVGYFEEPEQHRFGLVYNLPDGIYGGLPTFGKPLAAFCPFTLLSVLNADSAPGSSSVPHLEDRFRLAYNLASTFLRLRTKSIVHRDVTSNNVVFFRPPRATSLSSDGRLGRELRRPYLCSFDVFTEADVELRTRPHIYRHPLDAGDGERPRRAYRPAFDIYGLGLILLEIGLWMPLSSFWKARYDLPTFKSRIEDIYAKKLGPKCGTLYMRAVESSLTAADRDHAAACVGQKFDTQWSLYCEVVKRLEQCCALDEGDPPEQALEPVLPPTPLTLATPSEASQPETLMSMAESRPPPLLREHSSQVTIQSVSANVRETPSAQAKDGAAIKDRNGAGKPRMKVFPVKLHPHQLKQWHNVLLTRLERLMEQTLQDPTETFTIDLVAIGESAQTARPTILVTCASVAVVKDVLSRRFKFDRNTFSLRVRSGKLRRSLAKPSRKRWNCARRSGAQVDEEDPPVMNGAHQSRPLCGASIGAYKNRKHSPAVSYGGVVLVDGEPYGMTVHHLLDWDSGNEEDDEDGRDSDDDYEQERLPRSSAQRTWEQQFREAEERITGLSYRPHDEEVYLSDLSGDELSPAGESDDEADFSEGDIRDQEPADKYPDDVSVLSDTGDIAGVELGQGHGLRVTQPAIDDLPDGYYPVEDDKNEEHLASHELGWVHASSGIRRCMRNGVKHEIDWALLKIEDDRLQPHNVIQGGRRYCRKGGSVRRPSGLRDPICRQPGYKPEEDLFPNDVARMEELGSLGVHCVGRTSGLQSGVISPAMSSVRVLGRRTTSRSWHVVGGFGVAGDSGAWVIDNERGRVCGHVLAWSSKNKWAYICPMQLLLEDIRERLGVNDITLPDATADIVAGGYGDYDIPAEPALASAPVASRTRDEPSSHRPSFEAESEAAASSLPRTSHDGDKMVAGGLPQLSELRISGTRRQSSSSGGGATPSDVAAAAAAAAERSPLLAQDSSRSGATRPFSDHRPSVVMVEGHRMPSQMARG